MPSYFVSDKDYEKRLGVGRSSDGYSGRGYEPDEEEYELTEKERKIVEVYNKPKNEAAFRESRKYFNQALENPDSEDHELAKKLAPYIQQDSRKVKYTENGFVRGASNATDFVKASNVSLFGGILGNATDAVTWVGGKVSGASDEKIKKSQQEIRSVFGMSEEQQRKKDEENRGNSWYETGQKVGDAQRIATDIATTVIPGMAAEKAIRGIGFMSKLGSGGRIAKTIGDVIANVGGGAAATAVGAAKDPESLTAENVGTNVAIDAGLGLAGGMIGTVASKVRGARNAKELTKALDEVNSEAMPKKYSDKLAKLQGSTLSGKKFNEQVNEIMEEARSAKKFDVLADGATMNSATIKTRLDDIDKRLAEADTPEYAANNGLLNTEAAKARYDELMADATKIPGVSESTRAITEAEEQLKYYNKLRVDDPFARKIDKIRDKITKIEQSKQAELDNLARMSEDEVSEFDPRAFDELNATATKQYDELIAKEQSKIDELMASDPEKAAELQMLDEAEKTVELQRMDAQEKLDTLTKNQAEIAAKEAEEIAKTPNVEAIEQHKKFLEQKKQVLNKRYEDAKKRYESPNQKLEDVDEELIYMKEGTHPLMADGASKQKQFNRYLELNQERAKLQAKEIASSNPEIPKTEQEVAAVLDDALQEVATAKVGLGAKIGRIWSQPANQLRAAGFNKLADMRSDAVIAYNRRGYDIKQTVKEWGKMAKGNSSKDLFRAANGVEGAMEKLTPGGRKVVEAWREQAYELGKQMGLPEDVLKNGNYIPHLFTDVKRNPRLLDLQKKLTTAQAKIKAGGLDEKTLAKQKKHIEKLQESMREITENPGIVTAQDFIQETGEYSNRFLKERYGAEGYEENFWRATDAYMNAANTKVNLEPVMETFAKAKGVTAEKGMQKFLQTEIDKMRGTKADIDRGLDDWFNSLTKATAGDRRSNLGTKGLRGFRSAMSLSHIGFSANSAINTLAQASIMPGSLNIDGSMYGLYKGMELTGKLAKNTLSKTDTDEFKHMARMGVFEGSSHILPEQTASKYFNKFNKGAYAGITGADRYLRMSTYYGAKLKAERMGLAGMDAERYIYERVNEVNQNFSKLETPHAFRSQVAKTIGSMITFVPGMVVRSVEIGAKSIKGGADIIGHTVKGQPITRAEFLKDIDDISKGVFTLGGVWAMGNAIGAITGQDEVVPNPLSSSTYSSPALQFIFGSEYKTGVMGALTEQSGDQYDENGNNITHAERVKEFWTELMPSMLIPGYSQGKRTMEGLEINEKGYSETDKGGIRYMTDSDHDLQRAIFGQYSTPEGREYIKNMGRPGGGALTESESKKIKEAPVGLQNQYYDFFRETDKITGRSDANKEVTRLFRDEKRPEAARRKAEEFNKRVDEKLVDFFNKYPDIDDDLRDELKSNVYITLTERSEDARRRQ